MIKKILPRIFLALCIVACILFIWGNSSITEGASANISKSAKAFLDRYFGDRITVSEASLRKIAHICEFAVFGSILSLFTFGKLPKRLPAVLLCGMTSALCDETIQFFSDGRSPEVFDVWFDFGGFAAGVLIILAAYAVSRAVKKLKKRTDASPSKE